VTSNKQQKTKILLATIVISASTVITLLILNVVTGSNQSSSNQVSRIASKIPIVAAKAVAANARVYGLPVRLTIPKISVDTSVQNMGLTVSGNLQAPNNNTDVGWYQYGARPGNEGSAVVDGHLGLGTIKAVFSKLSMLQKGDAIMVVDAQGITASFVVRTTKLYNQDTQPAEVFTSKAGSHLNLITCNGDWEPGQRTYTQRLVVFTDKI
jgi:LPXTG-site transpeptidase (sortase) family protein